MSLPEESYRAVFKVYQVLVAICYSKHCKIPNEWRREIYYSLKHFMPHDIQVKGNKTKIDLQVYCSPESITKLVEAIDSQINPKGKKDDPRKSKVKPKRRTKKKA